MSAMFRSLRGYNYRIWFVGGLISTTGQWMQMTAQSWVVLTVLTDGDAAAMGVSMALQFAPPLLLVGPAGWVADRFSRRHILAVTQATFMALAVAMGVLLLTGVMTLPIMYAFAVGLGVVAAFDNPARQVFVSDLVSAEDTSNAVALNSALFNMARLVGPAVAGIVVVAVGGGWVFLVNAVTFLAMLIALALIRVRELTPRPRMASTGRITDGFRYVAKRPDLIVLFVIAFIMGAFGMNFPIYASTMAVEFGHDADGFGLLTSMLAIGSLVGALLAARRARAKLRVAIIAALGFGVAQFASIFMPSFWTYAAVLPLVGFAIVTMLTTANGYVQTTTDLRVRGRVMAVYMAILMGGTPIGAPVVGAIAEAWGPRAAILVAAGAGVVAFAIGAIWMLASGRVRRDADARLGLSLSLTRPIEIVSEPIPEVFSDEVASTSPISLDDLEEAFETASAGRPRSPQSRSPQLQSPQSRSPQARDREPVSTDRDARTP